MTTLRLTATLACALLLGLTWGTGSAPATDLAPGFDLFVTPPGGAMATIPGVGVVTFMGVPISPATLGSTDTVVSRPVGISPFPVGGPPVTVPIELIGLSLTSVAPVTISGFLYDVAAISGALVGGPASPLGAMMIDHSVPDGGTFVATLPVTALVSFTAVGGGPPIAPATVPDVLMTVGMGLWSHTPSPGSTTPLFPSGGFSPAVVPGTGGMGIAPLSELGMLLAHLQLRPPNDVPPAGIPEPSTFLLLTLGAAGLLGYGWRRRRAG